MFYELSFLPIVFSMDSDKYGGYLSFVATGVFAMLDLEEKKKIYQEVRRQMIEAVQDYKTVTVKVPLADLPAFSAFIEKMEARILHGLEAPKARRKVRRTFAYRLILPMTYCSLRTGL